MSYNIIIGADIGPTKSNIDLFSQGKTEELIGKELKEILDDSSFTIMNLEVPLTDQRSEIVKCGPCLSAPTSTISGLKSINPYFFTLANNHILDQDTQGLLATMECLEKNEIAFAGAGENIVKAKKTFITRVGGLSIGIYCCAEHEFSIALENKPGANPYDPLYSFDDVKSLKENTDIVIVLFHGGKEHYRYPSPELRRIFRKFAEVGGDYIIAQHTHCVGCIERYRGSTLVYGQGNFLFDNSDSEFWKTSVLLEIEIDNGNHSMKTIPCCKKGNVVRLASSDEEITIMKALDKRSKEIAQLNFVEKKYQEYARDMRKEYYSRLMGKIGRLFIVRAINRITN